MSRHLAAIVVVGVAVLVAAVYFVDLTPKTGSGTSTLASEPPTVADPVADRQERSAPDVEQRSATGSGSLDDESLESIDSKQPPSNR